MAAGYGFVWTLSPQSVAHTWATSISWHNTAQHDLTALSLDYTALTPNCTCNDLHLTALALSGLHLHCLDCTCTYCTALALDSTCTRLHLIVLALDCTPLAFTCTWLAIDCTWLYFTEQLWFVVFSLVELCREGEQVRKRGDSQFLLCENRFLYLALLWWSLFISGAMLRGWASEEKGRYACFCFAKTNLYI